MHRAGENTLNNLSECRAKRAQTNHGIPGFKNRNSRRIHANIGMILASPLPQNPFHPPPPLLPFEIGSNNLPNIRYVGGDTTQTLHNVNPPYTSSEKSNSLPSTGASPGPFSFGISGAAATSEVEDSDSFGSFARDSAECAGRASGRGAGGGAVSDGISRWCMCV